LLSHINKPAIHQCFDGRFGEKVPLNTINVWQTSWLGGQNFCLLTMGSRVRFPVLPWKFSLQGKIPTATIAWVSFRTTYV
jgi:hypothetical protein